MNWYFTTEGEQIALRARFEGDGVIGDAREEIGPGETFVGISYDELKAKGAGIIEVSGETGRIVDEETERRGTPGTSEEDESDLGDLDEYDDLFETTESE